MHCIKKSSVNCVLIMLLQLAPIVLTDDYLSTPSKRNQTLKTGTPHENNPMAEKPDSYGAKRNAGN